MGDHTVLQCSNGCAFSLGSTVVPGEGPVPGKFMIIGEAPTPMALAIGRPFPANTDSGRVLDKWLSNIGLQRDDAYITNLVKCPKRDDRWELQIHACLPWLEREIQAVKPRLVVTLGGEVHKRFTADYRPAKYRSTPNSPLFQVWEHYPSSGGCQEYRGVIYFALIHPSSAVRLGRDIPEYLPPDLDSLRKLVKRIY